MTSGHTVQLSIVVPMYNEEENASSLLERIQATIEPLSIPWELVLVNDGSTDGTLEALQRLAAEHPFVRIVSYTPNRGRGAALRAGFNASLGRWIISTDADLSYSPSYMIRMIEILREDPQADMVLASPYMKGGRVEGVPFFRHAVSRLGNRFLQMTLSQNIHTITCVFRAYRREVLDSMELESPGKEIHLEILSKALAVGRVVREIPAVLTRRQKGKSKAKMTRTTASHLVFSFMEKPMLLFGLIGLTLLLLGIALGLYLIVLYLRAQLNPIRPLMNVVAVLSVSGLIMLSFGFLAIKISLIRKEIYRIQKENLELRLLLTGRHGLGTSGAHCGPGEVFPPSAGIGSGASLQTRQNLGAPAKNGSTTDG